MDWNSRICLRISIGSVLGTTLHNGLQPCRTSGPQTCTSQASLVLNPRPYVDRARTYRTRSGMHGQASNLNGTFTAGKLFRLCA